MKRTLIQLACATAIGVLVAAAQAQTTSSTSPASNAELKAKADASYAAAKSICEGQAGTAKLTCLRNAKADYERWLKTGEVDEATATVGSGPGAGGAESTKSGNSVPGAKH